MPTMGAFREKRADRSGGNRLFALTRLEAWATAVWDFAAAVA